jgi:hypothetical protein
MAYPLDPNFKKKRIASQILTIRDDMNNCRVSGIFNFNNKPKMIVMTSHKNVYLIDKEREITKVSIKKWKKKFNCEIDDKEFLSIWDKSVYRRLKYIRKNEIKQKVERSPVKKIVRKPAKKKIKRRPKRRNQ